jgi:hypothetical protein
MYKETSTPIAPEDDVLEPFLSLLAARAKGLGLVAGTALLTSALVGGGAVAMTAVSHEGTGESAEVVLADSGLATDSAVATDTPTTDIGEDEVDAPSLDPVTGLPSDFTCDDSKNHGQNVSAYAQSLPKGQGRGELVSAVAKSDCGKGAEQPTEEPVADPAEEQETAVEAQSTEAEQPKEKPAKAQSRPERPAPARAAQSRPERPAPAKAAQSRPERPAPAKAAQSRPAKAPSGKGGSTSTSNGKGGGKGNGKS